MVSAKNVAAVGRSLLPGRPICWLIKSWPSVNGGAPASLYVINQQLRGLNFTDLHEECVLPMCVLASPQSVSIPSPLTSSWSDSACDLFLQRLTYCRTRTQPCILHFMLQSPWSNFFFSFCCCTREWGWRAKPVAASIENTTLVSIMLGIVSQEGRGRWGLVKHNHGFNSVLFPHCWH